MKKIIVIALLFLCTATAFWSCEKDDICAEGTPTTPSLIIEFYNNENRALPQPVSGFAYYVPGMPDTLSTEGSVSRIEVPLRTDAEATQWAFRLSTPVTGGFSFNTDLITFNYTTDRIYVSRACGFKTQFYLNAEAEGAPNPVITDATPADNLWIQDILVENPNIENEDEVHVKIFL